MKKLTLATVQLFLLSIGVFAQGTTTILSEGFESPTFPSTFSKSGNDSWNPGTPGANDYQSTFWDNLYTPTASTQTSEISTSEFYSGTQSLKLTVTTAAQNAASAVSATTYVKYRSKENTLTGNKTTILDWKNYRVTFWAKVTKTDGSSLGSSIVIFPENTTQTVNDNGWHQYTFNSTSAKYASGLTATKVIISMANNIGEDYIVYIDDVLVEKTDNIWTGASSIQWNASGNWSDGAEPTATRNVYIPLTRTYPNPQVSTTGNPQYCNDLIIASGVSLNYPAGATSLVISSSSNSINNGTINITAAGTLLLKSDVNGTATMINNGTISGTAKVQQYLTNQSWYLTSPVWDGVDILNAVTPTNLSRIQSYLEGSGTGNDWSVSGTTMKPYKGYITTVSDNPKTVEFTGKINSGDISIPLTRQGAGTENKYGFNLIGNPYTAYLDWKLVSAANTAKMPTTTMWYRTKASGSWGFSTVNGSGEKSPANVSDLIPPMQAFWVRATTVGNSTLDLTTAMIAHDNTSTNKMKAPAAPITERTKIRLQVSNGTNTDELLIYTDAQASNGFDLFDSPKMSNNSTDIPEISTMVNGENLVINGLKDLPLDTELLIHFMTKTANSFSLKSNELNNLPEGVKVILKDNGTEFDLTNGAEYNFSSDLADNANRFSLLFRSPGVTTDLENKNLEKQAQVFVNAANQITIIAPENSNYAIYNAMGQLIENGATTSNYQTSNFKPKTGVYVVKVNNQSTRVIIK